MFWLCIGVGVAVDLAGIGGLIWFVERMSTPSSPSGPTIPRLQ